MKIRETIQLEQRVAFDEKKEIESLLEQLEGVQQQVNQLAEKDHKDNLYLFRQLEVVENLLDKAKYKLTWTLPLHTQVKSLYI